MRRHPYLLFIGTRHLASTEYRHYKTQIGQYMGWCRRGSKVNPLDFFSYDEVMKWIASTSYLSVENDMNTFVRGFRLALKIGRSKPLVDELIFKDDTEESDSIFYPADADPDQVICILIMLYLILTKALIVDFRRSYQTLHQAHNRDGLSSHVHGTHWAVSRRQRGES